MAPNIITLILKGSRKDKGDVRLDEFLHELDALRIALKQAERKACGTQDPKSYYRIIGLSHNSPASVTIEGISRDIEKTKSTFTTFFSDLKHIRKEKTVPPDSDYQIIQAYRDLGAMRKKNIDKVTIKNGDTEIIIDDKFVKNIDKAMGPDKVEIGSIYGRLEVLNLHINPHFIIYPKIGPSKIDCAFDDSLREMVVKAIDHRVEVIGDIHFKSWDRYPHFIKVRELRIIYEENLPHLTELKGIAPKATGELSSLEFLRRVRGENA